MNYVSQPPARHGLGQEHATATHCNFPKVAFLMVAGKAIVTAPLSHSRGMAVAVGFLGKGGQGGGRWGTKPEKVRRA